MAPISGILVVLLLCKVKAERTERIARIFHRYLQLPLKQKVPIYLGTPKKAYSLQIAFQFDELVVLDASCGHTRKDCDRYCDDEFYLPLYCSPLCQEISPQTMKSLCRLSQNYQVYNGTKSTTAKSDAREWLRKIGGLRTLYGIEWSDKMVYRSKVSMGKPVLEVEIRFVSALLFDMRTLVEESKGLLGVAPGPNNPLLQIIEQKKFPRKLASFSNRRSHKFYMNTVRNRLLTVGQLDRGNCADFRWFPSVSEHAWAIAVDGIDFMGMKVKEKTTILLALGQQFTIIPTDLGERLIRNDVVQILGIELYRKCDPDLTVPNIRLFTEFGEIVLDNSAILRPTTGPQCFLHIQMNTTTPYATNEIWMLGESIMNQYCVGLDYERRLIGLAPLKKGSPFERW